jgi:hypothetical protein
MGFFNEKRCNTSMIKQLIISRIIMVWMFIISILLISYILTIYSDDNKLYIINSLM